MEAIQSRYWVPILLYVFISSVDSQPVQSLHFILHIYDLSPLCPDISVKWKGPDFKMCCELMVPNCVLSRGRWDDF